MSVKHGVSLTEEELEMMLAWDNLDPVDSWECKRNERIKAEQGVGNQFVGAQCSKN